MPWKQVEPMEQRPQFIQDARRRLVSFTKSVDHRRYWTCAERRFPSLPGPQ